MDERELIKDFVQRFTSSTNQLMLLGRSFDNANLVHKMLKSLTKEWQHKIIVIKESLKIGMLTIQELYRNLEEYELKLKWYKRNRDDKKKKFLALKASGLFDDDKYELDDLESKEDEDEKWLY